MKKYLKQTELLDFNHSSIQNLLLLNGWKNLPPKTKVLNIYNYVRDEIVFGYNEDDAITASAVLKDGYGQCNTKSTLFMALLRAVDIPCRLHGFAINKKLQKGAISGIWYAITPGELMHSWVEVFYNGKWLNLEGFILDQIYLQSVQDKHSDCTGSFCGYGIATKNLKEPEIYWNENDTYIQKEGIVNDFGIYDDPDSFFREHKQKLNLIKKFLFKHIIRKALNKKLKKTRNKS